MITRDEILKGRELRDPLTPELEANLTKLLTAVNLVRQAYGAPLMISSGYRPPRINSRIKGAAKNSAHLTCQAADIWDPKHALVQFLLTKPELLQQAGLWMEDPKKTPTWCHLQIRPVHGVGGTRVFLADEQSTLDPTVVA